MPPCSILIVFPHNFTDLRNGIEKRFFELIRYFNQRGFSVDLLALKNFQSHWQKGIEKKGLKGIRNLFLYDHSRGLKKTWIRNLISLNFEANRNLLGSKITHLPDYAFSDLRKMFTKIIRGHTYDFVLISYVQWANLLRGNDQVTGRKILTVEDCVSRNVADNHPKPVPVDQLLYEEAGRIDLFDEVICLSLEEMTWFSAHTDKPEFHYIPVFMNGMKILPGTSKEYDILFIGSNNGSNRKGIKWFFEFVYPLLHQELKILIAGEIVNAVPDLQGVYKIKFAENLQEIYQKSKIAINPLQDGTGMKVKVIESMAYGIPVVSTRIGLTGIRPELQNLFMIADLPEDFALLIQRLISDKTVYLGYSQTLNRIFNENFSYEVASHALDEIFISGRRD